MAEVDPKLCIALDDINEAMDCDSQQHGRVSYRPSSSAIMRTWPRGRTIRKRRNPLFHLRKPVHWSVTWL